MQSQLPNRFARPFIVGMLTDLITPHQIPRGAVVAMDPLLIEDIRAQARKVKSPMPICNLSLNELVHTLFGLFKAQAWHAAFVRKPESTLRQVQCPACVHQRGAAMCLTCRGTRRVLLPFSEGLSMAQVMDLQEQRRAMIKAALGLK